MGVNETELAKKKYPHMLVEEVRVWKRFLKRHGDSFTKYRYDVHVGQGIGRLPGYSKKLQNMAITLTQKRIDVVAARGAETFIVEIKGRASMSAIGQLMTYKILYEFKYGHGTVSGLAVVAESVDRDVSRVMEVFNIQQIIV